MKWCYKCSKLCHKDKIKCCFQFSNRSFVVSWSGIPLFGTLLVLFMVILKLYVFFPEIGILTRKKWRYQQINFASDLLSIANFSDYRSHWTSNLMHEMLLPNSQSLNFARVLRFKPLCNLWNLNSLLISLKHKTIQINK